VSGEERAKRRELRPFGLLVAPPSSLRSRALPIESLGAIGVPGTLGLVQMAEGGVDGYCTSGVPAVGVPIPCRLRVESRERASPMDSLGAIGVSGTLGLVQIAEGGVDGYCTPGELDSVIMSRIHRDNGECQAPAMSCSLGPPLRKPLLYVTKRGRYGRHTAAREVLQVK